MQLHNTFVLLLKICNCYSFFFYHCRIKTQTITIKQAELNSLNGLTSIMKKRINDKNVKIQYLGSILDNHKESLNRDISFYKTVQTRMVHVGDEEEKF